MGKWRKRVRRFSNLLYRFVLIADIVLYSGIGLVILWAFGFFDIKEAITLTIVLFGVEYLLYKFITRSQKETKELAKAIKQLSEAVKVLSDSLKSEKEKGTEKAD